MITKLSFIPGSDLSKGKIRIPNNNHIWVSLFARVTSSKSLWTGRSIFSRASLLICDVLATWTSRRSCAKIKRTPSVCYTFSAPGARPFCLWAYSCRCVLPRGRVRAQCPGSSKSWAPLLDPCLIASYTGESPCANACSPSKVIRGQRLISSMPSKSYKTLMPGYVPAV